MLTINSFEAEYLASRTLEPAQKLRNRLDGVVRRNLPDLLDRLSRAWEAEHPGVWFVRDVEVDLELSAGWSDDLMAERWAEKIFAGLVAAAGEATTVFFADRADYLARFLADLTAGRARGVWYYRPFDGLDPLSLSAAVRTALEEEVETGIAALTRLEAGELAVLLAALERADARRLLDAFSSGSDDDSHGEESGLLERCWQHWQPPGKRMYEESELLFHLLAAVQVEHAPAARLLPMVRALARLERLLEMVDGPAAGRLLSGLSSGDRATLAATAGASDARVMAPLLGADPALLWRIGNVLAGGRLVEPARLPHPSGAPEEEWKLSATPFGGAFLLLPLLALLPLDRAARDLPALGDLPAPAIFRFLVLAACLGAERSRLVLADPLLRSLFGVPPGLSLGEAARWGRETPGRLWDGFFEAMSEWQEASGMAGDGPQVALSPEGSREVILLDLTNNLWRAISTVRSLRTRLHGGETLYCAGEPTYRLLTEGLPGVTVASADDLQSEPETAPASALHARLEGIVSDREYLLLPRHATGSRRLSAAAALSAQNVLRLFARRLRGFSLSGMSYLYRNFLELHASMEERPERRIVRLGKPPLNLVLAMAGQNRQTYEVAWIGGPPFELHPQE